MQFMSKIAWFLFGKKVYPAQASMALGLGFLVGATPTFLTLQTLLALLSLLFFRMSLRLFIFSMAIAYILGALFLDRVSHLIGQFLLDIGLLKSLYAFLYNIPLIPLTKFNYSAVCGAFFISILLSGVSYLVLKKREEKANG